jgi:hypothetical protein
MALRFLVSGGTGNWNSTTNWAATSGGASGASFPTVSDDVTLDKYSNINLTVNVGSAALSFSASPDYTHSFVMTNGLSVVNNVTLSTGMTYTGAGTLSVTNTSTLTSNGKTITGGLSFSTSSTKTLNDNWTVTGLYTNTSTTTTINGNSLILNGGITLTGIMAGTTQIILQGGTWSGNFAIENPFAFSGNSTISGAVLYGVAGSPLMSYSAGTVTTTNSTLDINVNATLNCSAVTFNNVGILSSGGIVTLQDNLNMSGALSSGVATTTTINGAYNVNVLSGGSVVVGTNWGGTSTLNYMGGGQFSGGTAASILAINTIINTTGATFNSFIHRTSVLTWNNIGSSTFETSNIGLNTNPTWMVNCSGLSLNILQVGSTTVAATLSGTNGFNMNEYLANAGSASKTIFQSGNTYTINNIMSANTTLAFAHQMVSSTAGQRYFLTLTPGCICDVLFASITDADSSRGRTGWNNKGTLSNTVNWNLLPSSPVMQSSVF